MKETILRMSIIPDRQRPPGGEENESALIYFCFDLLNVPQLGCSRNEPIFISFCFLVVVSSRRFAAIASLQKWKLLRLLPHRRVTSLDSRGLTGSGTSDREAKSAVTLEELQEK